MLVGLALSGVTAGAAVATDEWRALDRAGAFWFRTTPGNAAAAAAECRLDGLAACGDVVTRGDGEQFASDCESAGRTADEVARALASAARRARSRGSRWWVYTRTERGGYPYTCRFGLVLLR
jgi:hypothetical protein